MFKEFYPLLEKFLSIYLPKQKGYSNHTVVFYYTAVSQYVLWLTETANIKKRKDPSVDFTKERVISWFHILKKAEVLSPPETSILLECALFLSLPLMKKPYTWTLFSL